MASGSLCVRWQITHLAPSLPCCVQAVFQRGLAHVPEALRQDNPSDVPAILATWIAGKRGVCYGNGCQTFGQLHFINCSPSNCDLTTA